MLTKGIDMPRLPGLAFGCLLAMAGDAVAQDGPLKKLQVSRDLFDVGMAEEAPLYLLVAARLRKSVAVKATDRKPEGGQIIDAQPFGWEDILAAAAPLIAGDPTLEGLAEDIRAEREKGVVSGPVYSIAEIPGNARDLYADIRFQGGQYAEIYVEGPSGSDLNLIIRDARDRLVCSDTDISAIAYCGWRPVEDGTFSITVENESGRGGRYSLITN